MNPNPNFFKNHKNATFFYLTPVTCKVFLGYINILFHEKEEKAARLPSALFGAFKVSWDSRVLEGMAISS